MFNFISKNQIDFKVASFSKTGLMIQVETFFRMLRRIMIQLCLACKDNSLTVKLKLEAPLNRNFFVEVAVSGLTTERFCLPKLKELFEQTNSMEGIIHSS